MSLGDENADGNMCFEEFVKYVTDHQKKLWIVFKTIDQDGSGEKLFVPLPKVLFHLLKYFLLDSILVELWSIAVKFTTYVQI